MLKNIRYGYNGDFSVFITQRTFSDENVENFFHEFVGVVISNDMISIQFIDKIQYRRNLLFILRIVHCEKKSIIINN